MVKRKVDPTLPNNLKRISVEDPAFVCVFCRTSRVDEVNLGPLYVHEETTTHYFCMLLSSGLSQNGSDDDGVLGFLPTDIKYEVSRAKRLRCHYCHTIGASVGCCDRKCRTSFHFPCGLRNGIQFQFETYESYCINHAKRKIPEIPEELFDQNCPICFSPIDTNPIKTSCCKTGIFHRECIQTLAYSAGYFFKCPTCNAEDAFRQDMRGQGIFVPEQDAAWELEPNAYQDLYQQYSHCDAKECECPKGREYGAAKGGFLLARCRICGAAGTHRQCGKLKTIANWACADCLEIETRTDKTKKAAKPDKPPTALPTITSRASVAAPAPTPRKPTTSKAAAKNIAINDDEDVNLNHIVIAPECFDYFPHTKTAVQRFAKRNNGLPDWRMLELVVNLVDFVYFNGLTEEGGDQRPERNPTRDTKLQKTTNAAKSISEVSADSSKTEAVVREKRKRPATAAVDRRAPRRKKGVSWQRGVVRKRRKTSQKSTAGVSTVAKKPKTAEEATGILNSESSPKKETLNSTAVLEGIQSMTRWLKVPGDPKKELEVPTLNPDLKIKGENKTESPALISHTDAKPKVEVETSPALASEVALNDVKDKAEQIPTEEVQHETSNSLKSASGKDDDASEKGERTSDTSKVLNESHQKPQNEQATNSSSTTNSSSLASGLAINNNNKPVTLTTQNASYSSGLEDISDDDFEMDQESSVNTPCSSSSLQPQNQVGIRDVKPNLDKINSNENGHSTALSRTNGLLVHKKSV